MELPMTVLLTIGPTAIKCGYQVKDRKLKLKKHANICILLILIEHLYRRL